MRNMCSLIARERPLNNPQKVLIDQGLAGYAKYCWKGFLTSIWSLADNELGIVSD
jgi:hypothetical protein